MARLACMFWEACKKVRHEPNSKRFSEKVVIISSGWVWLFPFHSLLGALSVSTFLLVRHASTLATDLLSFEKGCFAKKGNFTNDPGKLNEVLTSCSTAHEGKTTNKKQIRGQARWQGRRQQSKLSYSQSEMFCYVLV